jgi:hypothetical protein
MERAAIASGRIFISYRREEAAYPAGWLFDRLTEHFGAGSVFKDVDSIDLGDDFAAAITAAVTSCDVLLALIGERWATMTDEYGRRRLDRPDDFVRREIEAALTRDVRVIPILVDRARMPQIGELPPSLAPLVRRQALDIDPSRFALDTARLIAVLEKTLAIKQALPAAPDGAAPRHRRAWVAVSAGVAAALTAAFVVATSEWAAPPADTSTAPTTAPTPTSTPTLASTPTLTRPASPGAVLADDDFSSTAYGWKVPGESARGVLANGAYRVSVAPVSGGTGAGAYPLGADGIYPVAPSDVVVEVTGSRLVSSESQLEYGVRCRANIETGFGYFLALSNQYAEIAKSSPDAPYKLLRKTPFPVEAGVAYRLRAECRSENAGTAVRLSLSVDDRPLVEYVDRTNPLPEGCVGLRIGMDGTASRAGEVEFDDFTVRS